MSWLLRRLACGMIGVPAEPPRVRICDRFANVRLTNQFGEQLKFHDALVADDRALVLNTMYTQCRGTCPGTSEVMEVLRQKLSPVFGRRLTFVSLTIEPDVDSYETLFKYSRAYGGHKRSNELCDWLFLTGSADDVNSLRRSLSYYDLDEKVDQDVTQHASTLMFGNSRTDRWAWMPSELAESQLVASIRRVAGSTFEQKYGIRP